MSTFDLTRFYLPIICSLNCKYSHWNVITVKTNEVKNETTAIISVNCDPNNNETKPPRINPNISQNKRKKARNRSGVIHQNNILSVFFSSPNRLKFSFIYNSNEAYKNLKYIKSDPILFTTLLPHCGLVRLVSMKRDVWRSIPVFVTDDRFL